MRDYLSILYRLWWAPIVVILFICYSIVDNTCNTESSHREIRKGLTVTLNVTNPRYENSDKEIFIWEMGDGTKSTGKSIKHQYAYPGIYWVSLHVKNNETASIDRHVQRKRIDLREATYVGIVGPDSAVSGHKVELDASYCHIENTTLKNVYWKVGGDTVGTNLLLTNRFKSTGIHEIELIVKAVERHTGKVIQLQTTKEIFVNSAPELLSELP